MQAPRKGGIRDMNFGERVRELRKEQGMSQRELANRAGIDFTYLSKIENTRMDPPSEKVILRIAEALNTDADQLTVLAGKVPSYVVDILRENPEAIKMLRRSFSGDFSSREEFSKTLGDGADREK
jgi:HTH-type transcriptional regulator, competence development regulator